jgi:hypothetical protein
MVAIGKDWEIIYVLINKFTNKYVLIKYTNKLIHSLRKRKQQVRMVKAVGIEQSIWIQTS